MKRNVVFLHHVRSNSDLLVEVRKAPEDIMKAIEKTIKEDKIVIYTHDLSEECNDMLMEKMNLKNPEDMKNAYEKRCSVRNINIMKYSAKVAKARTTAGVKRKYDLCITAANVDHSPDGMPVVAHIFDTFATRAPALCVGRKVGDKVADADVRHTFNVVIVLTKDALTCPALLDEIKSALEAEASILLVHHITSCPDINAELAKCEDKVLSSSLARSARFTYQEKVVTSVVLGILFSGQCQDR